MSGHRWKPSELHLLNNYITRVPPTHRHSRELADLLGRSANSVIIKCNRLGIRLTSFSQQEDCMIREAYRRWNGIDVTIHDLANLLKRPYTSVCSRANRLGLTDKFRPKPYARGINPIRWSTAEITPNSQRRRARKLYQGLGDCELCGKPAVDRHHKDGNTGHNAFDNIQNLCRRCHMEVDGRLAKLIEAGKITRVISLPRPCAVCSRLYKPLRRGRCHSCNEYLRRNGKDRR